MEVLNFYFRGHSYCVDILKVSEVLTSAAIFPLPGTPRPLEGLFQVRGNIISLVDFSVCFGQQRPPQESQIVIFAEPFRQFAIRIPAPVEAKNLDFGVTQFPDEAPGLLAILDGTCSDGIDVHHLISPQELVAEIKDLLRFWKETRETENSDR